MPRHLPTAMDVKSPAKQLHESLNLYVGDDFYSLEPPDSSNCLTINRTTGNIALEQPTVSRLTYIKPTARVFGIVGLLSLTTSDFLILVTGRKSHGHIFGHEVYRATDFKILPLDDASRLHQHPVESHLLALVRAHLSGGTFWFSYTWDLTKRLQAQRMARHQDVAKALWETADDRFFWNKFLHSRFIDITTSSDQDLSSYILPVMYGTFDDFTASINSRSFRFCLISRRSRYRAGTRYFTRGVDENGNVANFNETEQILILNEDGNQKNAASVMSFVQIRGSVPVYWAEVNNLRYTPDLQIMELQDTADKFKLHFQKQISTYGSQHVVNLVKQKGREKLVKEAYERFLAEMVDPDVKYDYFDFHTECKNMQFHRIELLVNRIKSDLVEKGYFHDDDTNSTPRNLQTGVIRTNCMDNLDRTNVVQSALGRWVLTQQLREVGILGEKESVDDFEEFMEKFRNLWADHADAISKAYSGSGALKTDVTRTGKRTNKGMIQDGVNSITRYLKNNYFDGARQDAFDIFTGAWAPKKGPSVSTSLLFDDRPLIVRSMPYVLFYSIFMVFAGLTLPRSSDYSLVYYFLIWICLASISLGYIFIHGIDYVSWPRLNPPVDVIHYDGPGHKSGHRGRRLSRAAQRGIAAIGRSIRRPRRNTRIEEVEMGTLKKRLD